MSDVGGAPQLPEMKHGQEGLHTGSKPMAVNHEGDRCGGIEHGLGTMMLLLALSGMTSWRPRKPRRLEGQGQRHPIRIDLARTLRISWADGME